MSNVDCPCGQSAEIANLRAEVERLTSALADCYRASGADPDGNEDWRLAPSAVAAVEDLRKDYDAAGAEVARLTKERDEARGNAERYAADILRVMAQRDEARELMLRACRERDAMHEAVQKDIARAEAAEAMVKELESGVDTEQARWQDAIKALCDAFVPAGVDGSACDSGDPLDLSLDEIRQALAHVEDRAESAEARVAALEDFVRDVRDNYDCDRDAHTHNTRCRACEAWKLHPTKPCATCSDTQRVPGKCPEVDCVELHGVDICPDCGKDGDK